jgi:hypothetical protein
VNRHPAQPSPEYTAEQLFWAWMEGCSCTSPFRKAPWECAECTSAFLRAMLRALDRQDAQKVRDPGLSMLDMDERTLTERMTPSGRVVQCQHRVDTPAVCRRACGKAVELMPPPHAVEEGEPACACVVVSLADFTWLAP